MAAAAPSPEAAPAPAPATTGAASLALLRRVELRIARRLDGLLQGERRGRRPGPGDEPSLTRRYEPGDDVRWVDWPLSARMGEPMVRVPELEPVLTAWALVDLSPSMAFGTTVRTKHELGREVLAGLGTVLRRRGDRLGLAATVAGRLDLLIPPRADRRGLVASLAALDRIPVGDAGNADALPRAVTLLGRIARHRGLVAIISDFPPAPGLERAIGALSRKHEVFAVEVRDPRERDIPAVGPLSLRDMETGRTVLVDTADKRFQERFRQVTQEADRERAAMLARAGARHLIASTDSDWVLPLARSLTRAPRRRKPA